MSKCISITTTNSAIHLSERSPNSADCLTDDHGLLRQQDGRTVFGFIHGNWALDNSRPDGKVVRSQRRNRFAARSRLLRRLHHAVSSVGDPRTGREPDLLVHKQPRQPSEVFRSWNRGHRWRWQTRRSAHDYRAGWPALWRPVDAAAGDRRDRWLRHADAIAGAPLVRSGSHHRRRSISEALHPRRARKGISNRCSTVDSAICSTGSRKKQSEEASRFTGPQPGRCTARSRGC